MRYFVLATDYDGTLATDGRVHDETLTALKHLRASGRKLILVTGRNGTKFSYLLRQAGEAGGAFLCWGRQRNKCIN
jgi:HAD superfamily hydrolase (TIGR01484 family)